MAPVRVPGGRTLWAGFHGPRSRTTPRGPGIAHDPRRRRPHAPQDRSRRTITTTGRCPSPSGPAASTGHLPGWALAVARPLHRWACPGRSDRHRRLRDRILVAGLPGAFPRHACQDRPVIRDAAGRSESGAGVFRAIVEIWRALSLTTVAEGIETQTELQRLRELGCGPGQPYLVSRPLQRDAMADLVTRQGPSSPARSRWRTARERLGRRGPVPPGPSRAPSRAEVRPKAAVRR